MLFGRLPGGGGGQYVVPYTLVAVYDTTHVCGEAFHSFIHGNFMSTSISPHNTYTQRYVPHFKTMFSCLRHHPRQAVTLDMTDPVPSHVSRQWRGYGEHARETLIRYKRYAAVGSRGVCFCCSVFPRALGHSIQKVHPLYSTTVC